MLVIKVIRNKEKATINVESIIEVIKMNECLCIAAKDDVGIAIPFDSFKKEEDMAKLEDSLKKYVRQV